jgi:hypothetical protein
MFENLPVGLSAWVVLTALTAATLLCLRPGLRRCAQPEHVAQELDDRGHRDNPRNSSRARQSHEQASRGDVRAVVIQEDAERRATRRDEVRRTQPAAMGVGDTRRAIRPALDVYAVRIEGTDDRDRDHLAG